VNIIFVCQFVLTPYFVYCIFSSEWCVTVPSCSFNVVPSKSHRSHIYAKSNPSAFISWPKQDLLSNFKVTSLSCYVLTWPVPMRRFT
jgi:hypothetical protein